jgi:hypothetical protein
MLLDWLIYGLLIYGIFSFAQSGKIAFPQRS